ncbi:SpoIVB peptidase [Bacillus sp. FJAT-45350]|uniref:SpoIVB peptidase n=1 Tax=Bacillus sp. FJAT-45350 TaxID=2011014 RepID=UPI000BB9BC5D|nr:SpoIVB peptidase [Bacillus sp. FJAT-45350]
MKGDTIRKIIGVILLVSLFSIGFYKPVQQMVTLPDELVLYEGEIGELQASKAEFGPLTATPANEDMLVFNMMEEHELEDTMAFTAEKQGDTNVTLEVGSFPVKKVNVNVIEGVKVIPGGQSIGVKLNTDGVLVVGHHLVHTEEGDKSPGEIAGIEVGDMITKMNGKAISKMNQVASIVQEAGDKGEPIDIEVKREKETLSKQLTPLKAKGESSYRLGLYIRDSAAGVGTLTFYEPESKKYGALGHVISDMDTQKPIVVHDGHIIESSVTSIEKGSNGDPGEKLASFSDQRSIIGTITKNSPFGIFGEITARSLKNNIHDKALPVVPANQVKEGPAKILTVVEDEEVQEFDIEIVNSVPQKFPATKGLVIKVTDPKLLDATGGIVQGMSGSPIIQDGKVIGAVTHVFVNDPTSGYGCHIEWMLQEAGVELNKDGKAKAS